MAQICGKCSVANPPDAVYCYHDGALLEGHQARGGTFNRGSQPFPNPFIFPSGKTCSNFDQLAIACQDSWPEAVDLLRQGFLAGFLGGLGRADLARAAQEAAQFPDADRGLDQLLAKLPTGVLEAPQLKAEPGDVNLGIVPMGQDRQLELQLSNLGARLLYGSVVSDAKWLTLGEPPGTPQRLFQCRDETVVHVHVRGQQLRAGTRPLEARLLIDSSGGQASVRVRLEVPVKPFPDGVLAGARTPREVAVKAKQSPKEAAALFERGAVAQWYKDNGWTYPVQAPTASGLGAVQQFFEALGLATAPRVEVAQKEIHLAGTVGQALRHELEVRTPEKRAVYAYATGDQPWLDVGRARLNGRIAIIPVQIPHVPDRPGETVQATIHVTANGNQRFTVPVTLVVAPASPFDFGSLAAPMPVLGEPIAAETVTAVLAAPLPEAPEVAGKTPRTGAAHSDGFGRTPAERRSRRGHRKVLWVHVLPAGLLLLALVGTVAKDFLSHAADSIVVDPHPRVRPDFDFGKRRGNTMSFGLVMIDPGDPRQGSKRLTFSPVGSTNNTLVRIDGTSQLFGRDAGRWAGQPERSGRWGGLKATWLFDQQVHVTQTVQVIPGEAQAVSGQYRRLLDTCLVRYTLENRDRRNHKVGMRLLLDTYIGSKDGVPFTVPGLEGLVDTKKDFRGAEVPDFVQVLENPDLKDPGTVAQLNLRLGGKLEAPERISLTHYPDDNAVSYEVPLAPIAGSNPLAKGENADSAVVLYWEDRDLAPRAVREVGFTYGLASVGTATGELAIAVGGALVAGSELTVVGLVTRPQPDETLTLVVPDGLTLSENTPATQKARRGQKAVANRPSPVTWRVGAARPGTFTLTIRSSTGATQERLVTIKADPIF